jgi:hypothetical protein
LGNHEDHEPFGLDANPAPRVAALLTLSGEVGASISDLIVATPRLECAKGA